MTTDNIEFYYICHLCEKRIPASTANFNMVPGKKKHEWLFECKEGCSKNINEVE